MEKLRILVVDDHPLIGESLELFLNQDPGLMVVGTANNGIQGIELLRKWNPDLVILDLSMPKLHGLEAIRHFLAIRPQVLILVFSGLTEDKFVHQALKAGARGYVVKGASTKELKQAIQFLREGGYWVSPQLSKGIIERFLGGRNSTEMVCDPVDALSEREKQVMQLMVQGMDTETIGNILHVSVNTVAKHRISLMKKLGLRNVAELTRFAVRHGLIEA